MVENVGQSFWIGKRTVPQSQGGPQILKGGPNFEQKGDQKGTQKFSELFTKSEYVKIVEKISNAGSVHQNLQRWSIFTCRTTPWGQKDIFTMPCFQTGTFNILNGLQWYGQLFVAFFKSKIEKWGPQT